MGSAAPARLAEEIGRGGDGGGGWRGPAKLMRGVGSQSQAGPPRGGGAPPRPSTPISSTCPPARGDPIAGAARAPPALTRPFPVTPPGPAQHERLRGPVAAPIAPRTTRQLLAERLWRCARRGSGPPAPRRDAPTGCTPPAPRRRFPPPRSISETAVDPPC